MTGTSPIPGHARAVLAVCCDHSAMDWTPLERFAAASRFDGLDADDFMWMGRCELEGGESIHLYKHADTRRHLNLDAAGHAYRYLATGGIARYELIDPHQAIVAITTPIAALHWRDGAERILDDWRHRRTSSGSPGPSIPPPGVA